MRRPSQLELLAWVMCLASCRCDEQALDTCRAQADCPACLVCMDQRCRPDQEICGDRVDNDCDGSADEGCDQHCSGDDCFSPPERRCLDASRLEYFEAPGVCLDGLCEYARREATCSLGCDAGACTGEECLGRYCPDDGNPCTDEVCTPETGCTSLHREGPCEDGDLCTGPDSCSQGICVVGAAIDCDDGIACTRDSCAPAEGCGHLPDDLACDDGDECTRDGCSISEGCVFTATGEPCDDGDACTMQDACLAGGCRGVPLDEDGDGFVASACGGTDCDDSIPWANPSGVEYCDGLDDDCDGLTDVFGEDMCNYTAICRLDRVAPMSCPVTPGPTLVSGVIDEGTTWCASGSPYLVTGDLVVRDGAWLTVGPCVEVLVAEGATIFIGDSLVVNADPAYPAVFRSALDEPYPGSWEAIHVGGAYRFEIHGALIRDARSGIYSTGSISSFAQVTDTRFEANLIGWHGNLDGGAEDAERIEFVGNGCGLEAHSMILRDCLFQDNDVGVCEGSSLFLYDSRFIGNAIGFRGWDSSVLDGCLFEDNGQAVIPGAQTGSTASVSRSVLRNNGAGIVVGYYTGSIFRVGGSVLCDNGTYDLVTMKAADVDATGNWWCTTDPGEISARIFDVYDDASLGRVYFEPFLSEEPQSAWPGLTWLREDQDPSLPAHGADLDPVPRDASEQLELLP